MKILKIIGLLFTVLLSINTWSQKEWKSLEEEDYAIQYPETWELNKQGMMGTSFLLFSPISSKEDKFRENINLIIQDLKGLNINLDKYIEISENQIKTLITNGNLIESLRLNENNLDFHKLIYTGTQGIFDLKFEQYFWVENEKAYVLTFTCEEDQFSSYKEIGEKILNSFRLN